MDIKSKSIRFSSGAKITAVILVWICFVGFMGSAIILLNNEEIADSDNYFDTITFKKEFERLVHNVVEANVLLKSAENIKAAGMNKELTEEYLNRFSIIKSRLSGMVNFVYCVENTASGERITNVKGLDPVKFIREQPVNVYISSDESRHNMKIYGDEVEKMLLGTEYEVYAAVVYPIEKGDLFFDEMERFSRIKGMKTTARIIIIPSFILLATAAAYLAYAAGRKEAGGEIILLPIDRLYTDVHTILVLIAAVLSMSVTFSVPGFDNLTYLVIPFIVLTVDAFIGISYSLSMVRQFKAGTLFRNTLIRALYKECKAILGLCLGGKMFRASILLMLLAYGLINGILFIIITQVRHGFMLLIVFGLLLAFNAAAAYFTARSMLSLTRIMEAAKEISAGNIDYNLKESEISLAFSNLAGDIRNIQGGLKKAVAEAIKGERMKTDLITNVSHDLKTPLTSIINYVDLLKKEKLENQKAASYVEILEEKSARLKQLVEDLVEASKASSGNLAVNAGKVDLHELVLQACGEYEAKIKEAKLDVRINSEESSTFIYADGKHMWRIIENLLSNAVKYSLPNSRVYINLQSNDNYGSFTIKSVSAFPLDIPPEQLTERFVRGDASRSTEGSGLGLSIAQSLTELQGGKFDIEIDGDLFKVNVAIPLWRE